MGFSMPDLEAIREELYRRIDAAAARGGLDAGNVAYADQWIDDLLAGWLQDARKESRDHTHVAAQIVGANLENLTISYNQLSPLENEVRAAEAQEEGFLAELLSEKATVIEVAKEAAKEALQVTLHTLPESSQLRGLDPRPVVPSISAVDTTERVDRKQIDGGEPENVRLLSRTADDDPIEHAVSDSGDGSSAPSTGRTFS